MSEVMAFTSIYATQHKLTAVTWFFFVVAISDVVIRPFTGRIFDFKGSFCCRNCVTNYCKILRISITRAYCIIF